MHRASISSAALFSFAAVCGPTTAQSVGSFITSGLGCPQQPSALYETWDLRTLPPQRFDLDGTALSWIPNGAGCYLVTPTGSSLPASASRVDTLAGDNTVTGPWPLGFTFFDATGTPHVNAGLASNGYVYLTFGSTTDDRCCNGTTALLSFLNDGPSFAVFGQDLNANRASSTGGGRIWFDRDTVAGIPVAYWTWDSVGENNVPGAINSCQMQLWADGTAVMVWSGVANVSHDALVGWSAGGGQRDIGPRDLSGAPFDCGRVAEPVALTSRSFPTIGQTTTLDLRRVPANATGASIIFGLRSTSLALDPIGMERCTLYTFAGLGSIDVTNLDPVAGTGSVDLVIGNSMTFDGLVLYTQCIGLAPGSTTLGAFTSDLGTITIGASTARAVVAAMGSNSFNSDTSAGFWRVSNFPGSAVDITGVTLDWIPSTVAAHALTTFDTDQDGMADRFDGGDSMSTSCRGTYRNGSAATVGLDYAGTGAPFCDGSAQCGWTTLTGVVGGSNRDVSFAFTDFGPGKVFEWDMDVDNGPGFDGAAMDGCVVTVTFSDGSSATTELRAIAPAVSRAVF